MPEWERTGNRIPDFGWGGIKAIRSGSVPGPGSVPGHRSDRVIGRMASNPMFAVAGDVSATAGKESKKMPAGAAGGKDS